jgi:hypothetical protein
VHVDVDDVGQRLERDAANRLEHDQRHVVYRRNATQGACDCNAHTRAARRRPSAVSCASAVAVDRRNARSGDDDQRRSASSQYGVASALRARVGRSARDAHAHAPTHWRNDGFAANAANALATCRCASRSSLVGARARSVRHTTCTAMPAASVSALAGPLTDVAGVAALSGVDDWICCSRSSAPSPTSATWVQPKK